MQLLQPHPAKYYKDTPVLRIVATLDAASRRVQC